MVLCFRVLKSKDIIKEKKKERSFYCDFFPHFRLKQALLQTEWFPGLSEPVGYDDAVAASTDILLGKVYLHELTRKPTWGENVEPQGFCVGMLVQLRDRNHVRHQVST